MKAEIGDHEMKLGPSEEEPRGDERWWSSCSCLCNMLVCNSDPNPREHESL